MVFCNLLKAFYHKERLNSHNPYFNRWFSAIELVKIGGDSDLNSHNPYFNRWFSAIVAQSSWNKWGTESQSLF